MKILSNVGIKTGFPLNRIRTGFESNDFTSKLWVNCLWIAFTLFVDFRHVPKPVVIVKIFLTVSPNWGHNVCSGKSPFYTTISSQQIVSSLIDNWNWLLRKTLWNFPNGRRSSRLKFNTANYRASDHASERVFDSQDCLLLLPSNRTITSPHFCSNGTAHSQLECTKFANV